MCPQNKSTVSSLMYDDGQARFSVFLGSLDGGTVTETHAQGRDDVSVVGEIPIGTAERITLSMRSQDAQVKH